MLMILGLLIFSLAARGLALIPCDPNAAGSTVGQWQPWEQTLTSTQDYVGSDKRGNPYRDITLRVTFTKCDPNSPSTFQGYGFWYGVEKVGGIWVDSNRSFRIRNSFPAGTWRWTTTCTGKTTALTLQGQPPLADCSWDHGLHQQSGIVHVALGGPNALYRSGLLGISEDSRYLTYTNTYSTGSSGRKKIPFFWLGDTAWNASIAASQADWQAYIDDRATDTIGRMNTAFTVVQVGVSPTSAGLIDVNLHPPFDLPSDPSCKDTAKAPNACSIWNSRYWADLDAKIQYANQRGLVVFFAGLIEPLQKDLGPGIYPDQSVFNSPGLVTLAQNVAARYAGNFVICSPGFDHKVPMNASAIRAVGQKLGDITISHNLVSNHPAGMSSLNDIRTLQADSWLSFQMYQSGSPGGNAALELTNMTDRASSLALGLSAVTSNLKPVINGEAAYDGSGPFFANHTSYRARQTAYLSFLSGATGYSSGTCGIYDWGKGTGGCPVGLSWQTAMTRLTSRSMRYLRFILQTVNWQRLRPDSARILPPTPPPTPYTKAVLAYDGNSAIVAYLPTERVDIQINFGARDPLYQAVPGLSMLTSKQGFQESGWVYRWFSPRTGNSVSVPGNGDLSYVSRGVFLFTKPTVCDHDQQDSCSAADNDWVLRLTKTGGPQPPVPGIAASHLEVSNEIGAVSGSSAIVAQRIDESTGNSLSYVEMGGGGTYFLGSPQVAIESGGNSFLVWQSEDSTSTTIMGRVLDSMGNPTTAELVLNSENSASPMHPAVAALDSGNFVVTWSGLDNSGDGPWIWYRFFDASGSASGPEQAVVSCSQAAADFPSVIALAGGGFAVAWELGAGGGVYFSQLDSAGNSTGIEGSAASGSGGWPVLQGFDNSSGTLALSWSVYSVDGTSGTPTANDGKLPVPSLPLPTCP
jgi:hypothetical protein